MNAPQTSEKHPDLRRSFIYDDLIVDPIELWKRYAHSEHGRHHSMHDPRFSQSYDYGTPRQLIADLGDDVHPVRHMRYTHDAITVPFLAAQRDHPSTVYFSEEEEAELRTASVLHDIGECTHTDIEDELGFTFGDIEYGIHQDNDKCKEEQIRNFLYMHHFSDIPPRLLWHVDSIVMHATEEETVRAFKIIEHIGYYTTALSAQAIVAKEASLFDQDKARPDKLMRIAQLGRLATIVAPVHRKILQEAQHDYPYVRTILSKA